VAVETVLQKLEEATASAVDAVTLRDLAGPSPGDVPEH
jgi:hypothetical protein